jgi:dTDP-4-dehydrorhamnose 3,5-epimerase
MITSVSAMPMPVQIQKTELPEVLVVQSNSIKDDRGFFSETYSLPMLERAGFRETFVQDNLSGSKRGTVRGLHYQLEPAAMGKLVRVVKGAIFDVAVDIRRGSPTFGRWVGRELTGDNGLALWVPIGFAHGFLALEDDTLVLYKCSNVHTPEAERAIHFADPRIGIEWPFAPTIVSPKDAAAPPLERAEYNFEYRNSGAR